MLTAAAVGLLLGAAVVTATILLLRDEDSPPVATLPTDSSTVPLDDAGTPTQTGTATSGSLDESGEPQVGSVIAGRYVQAGSFRTVAGARSEQQRLAAQGVDIDVIESDQAQDLYPGFQVLVTGPLAGPGEEHRLVRSLRQNGVPSAFGRELSPARSVSGPDAILGRWEGTLERTGSLRPGLNGTLRASLVGESGGAIATLEVPEIGCVEELGPYEMRDVSLGYQPAGGRGCLGDGIWWMRPVGDELMVALLPPNTDVVVIGTLSRQ